MTRRRFVKLAMAKGCSRNTANKIAAENNAKGKTYAEGYAEFEQLEKLLATLVPAWIKTVEWINEKLGKMANAFRAGVDAFTEAFSVAMTEE